MWWLALDLRWTSFDELAERKVIAQAWKQLGDLSDLVTRARVRQHRDAFEEEIRARFRVGFEEVTTRAARTSPRA